MDINNFNFEGKKVLIRVDFNVPMAARGYTNNKTRVECRWSGGFDVTFGSSFEKIIGGWIDRSK